jgi:hypothetical protein
MDAPGGQVENAAAVAAAVAAAAAAAAVEPAAAGNGIAVVEPGADSRASSASRQRPNTRAAGRGPGATGDGADGGAKVDDATAAAAAAAVHAAFNGRPLTMPVIGPRGTSRRGSESSTGAAAAATEITKLQEQLAAMRKALAAKEALPQRADEPHARGADELSSLSLSSNSAEGTPLLKAALGGAGAAWGGAGAASASAAAPAPAPRLLASTHLPEMALGGAGAASAAAPAPAQALPPQIMAMMARFEAREAEMAKQLAEMKQRLEKPEKVGLGAAALLDTKALLNLSADHVDTLVKEAGVEKAVKEAAAALAVKLRAVALVGGMPQSAALAAMLQSILEFVKDFKCLPDLCVVAPATLVDALKTAAKAAVQAAVGADAPRMAAVAAALARESDPADLNVETRTGNRAFLTWILLALRAGGATLVDALTPVAKWRLGGRSKDHVDAAIAQIVRDIKRALLTVKGTELTANGANASVCLALLDALPRTLRKEALKAMNGDEFHQSGGGASNTRRVTIPLDELVIKLNECVESALLGIKTGEEDASGKWLDIVSAALTPAEKSNITRMMTDDGRGRGHSNQRAHVASVAASHAASAAAGDGDAFVGSVRAANGGRHRGALP